MIPRLFAWGWQMRWQDFDSSSELNQFQYQLKLNDAIDWNVVA